MFEHKLDIFNRREEKIVNKSTEQPYDIYKKKALGLFNYFWFICFSCLNCIHTRKENRK